MLSQLNSHFADAAAAKKGKPILNVWDSMKMDQHLSKVAAEKKLKVRHMCEKHYPLLIECYDKTDTPWALVEALKEVKINGG